jgi:hypothetical protein
VNPEDLPRLARKKLKREHRGLQAQRIAVGRWPFRRREWQVTCSCGWKAPKLIPVSPPEMAHVSDYLISAAMSGHIESELAKLPLWRRLL